MTITQNHFVVRTSDANFAEQIVINLVEVMTTEEFWSWMTDIETVRR